MTAFAQLVLSAPATAAAELRALIDAGLTAPQIAAKYGVNESTVRRWIYKLRDDGHLTVTLKLGARTRRGVPFDESRKARKGRKTKRAAKK